MYNKGDFVKLKMNAQCIWRITGYSLIDMMYTMESDFDQLKADRKISLQELQSSYIKVDKLGNIIKDDDQLSFYDDFTLPEGKKEEKYCYHDWKVYTGLNFSDEYCSKCNKKRELEKK